MARSRTLESGQSVSGIRSETSRSTSSGSSMQRSPWSTRSTPRTSRASRMYSGGPSSPAWATLRRPRAVAAAYTSRNFAGGWPTSAESRPTALMRCRYGFAASRVSSADSADLSRRKHMISWVEMPWVSSLRSSALPSPSIDGADRDTAVGVGLRVEEDLRVPDALGGGAGEVGVGQFGEVLLGAQDRHQGVVEVEEALQVVEEVGACAALRCRRRAGPRRCGRRGRRPARVRGCLRCGGGVRLWGGARCSRYVWRVGTGTLIRSWAMVSSPSKPAALAWRSKTSGSV